MDFKGKAKVFCRTYSFLSSVIPYSNTEWEKLSILLNLLVPKLPAPQEENLSKGILEAIDMDSYRVEKKAAMKIALADKDAEIEPVPTDAHGHLRSCSASLPISGRAHRPQRFNSCLSTLLIPPHLRSRAINRRPSDGHSHT